MAEPGGPSIKKLSLKEQANVRQWEANALGRSRKELRPDPLVKARRDVVAYSSALKESENQAQTLRRDIANNLRNFLSSEDYKAFEIANREGDTDRIADLADLLEGTLQQYERNLQENPTDDPQSKIVEEDITALIKNLRENFIK